MKVDAEKGGSTPNTQRWVSRDGPKIVPHKAFKMSPRIRFKVTKTHWFVLYIRTLQSM